MNYFCDRFQAEESSTITVSRKERRVFYRFLFTSLCLLSSASGFSLGFSTRQRRSFSSSPSCTWLRQSSTTVVLQETVSLKWTDFHTPQTPNANTPVVLLHGLLGSSRNFASLAVSLGIQLEQQRRIVGVDLRNHGDSEWSSSMSYEAMAHDVLDFLNAQDLQKVILVGHSMGGKVAQAMSLMHPNRVEGLVVLDIAPVQYNRSEPHWKAVEDILHAMHKFENVENTSKSELDIQLRTPIPDPALRAFVLTNYDNRQKKWKIPIGTLVNELETIAGFDIPASSTFYDGDVFIIHGGQSRFVRVAYMDQIKEYFPNHMLTTIRGAGHWVHAEAPDDTIALLKRYLDR